MTRPIENLPPRHDVPTVGRSGYVLLGERQVHYLEWGHARLPAVVCLHGGGQTAYMFEALGAALAGRYHVLAWDFADHGDSDPFVDGPDADTPLDRHALAADAGPLCAEFGITRAVFVGGSMGGVVSVTVAALRPDLVGGVVLLDVGHRLEVAGVQRIAAFLSELESFADLDEAAAAIAGYLPERTVTQGRLTRNLRQRADGRWVWKHGLGRHIRARGIIDVDQGAAAVVAGLEDDLRGLHRPALVLRGAASDVLSEAGADELVELLPDARYARISGAGHLAAGDNPESFVNLVARFLDEIRWADVGLNPL
ncbi:MAG TPA: alpha/beta hydrolase [Acidimicrobiia bacterium]|nr:alpha/beta hydrolase [Acidimicrobiia bacterium]